MSKPKLIEGFDYRLVEPDAIRRESTATWRAELREVLANGGRRMVVSGETWAKDAQGKLLFEVYGNVTV
jgi:hypothetical protein